MHGDGLDENDENFIRLWCEFLASDIASQDVPDYAFELENLQSVSDQPADSDYDQEEEPQQVVDREEWMFLSDFVHEQNNNTVGVTEAISEEERSSYSYEEIANLATWLNSQKGDFVSEVSQAPENEYENIDKLNHQQKKAFDLVVTHAQTDCSEQLLTLIVGKAGCRKSFLIDRLRYAG